MPIPSRWAEPLPSTSFQQWMFGSATAPLPSRKTFIDADRPDTHYVTFDGYRQLAKRIALGLQARGGLRPGDRVLLFSGNNIYFPSVFLGVLMAGGIFSGANPGFVARELAYQLSDSGATLMIAAEASLDTALDAARQAGLPADKVFVFDSEIPGTKSSAAAAAHSRQPHWTELLAPPSKADAWSWTEPADPATATCCLNYSSGTTGVPKGVEITHRNYVANCAAVVAVTSLDENHATAVARHRGLCFLPMYHAYAQTYFVGNFAKMGVPSYVMPSFDFEKLLAHVPRYRITHLTSVPPILVALTKHPAARKADLSSLEHIGCGAAPLAADIATETEKLLGRYQQPGAEPLLVRQGWGMTELTCTALTWDPRRRDTVPAVGELMPNAVAKLVDDDGNEVTQAGVRGELWIGGPGVMRGYWRNPKATAETLVTDRGSGVRWLRTGDIAYVNSFEPGALFFIVDRIKELIKVKGNQVAPAELEALLLERPDIADTAVVGVTIQGEEVPRAYVVKSPGAAAKLSGEEIAEWLAAKVSKHKRLRGGVVFIDAVPKNPSGKILRKILRDSAKKEAGDSDPRDAKL